MHNPDSKLYALTIIAHPDDESFLVAGVTLKFLEEGKKCGVICMTHGEKGADRLNRDLTPLQMAKIRTKELLKACHILKCDCKKIYDHPDGKLDEVNFDELVTELIAEINYYQPQIILTFGPEGISGHRDHIMIGKAALAAAQKADPKPSEVWLASIPKSEIKGFNEHINQRKVHHSHFQKSELEGVPDENLLKIDINKYGKLKQEAIKAHESQFLPHLVWPFLLEYECFEIIKLS